MTWCHNGVNGNTEKLCSMRNFQSCSWYLIFDGYQPTKKQTEGGGLRKRDPTSIAHVVPSFFFSFPKVVMFSFEEVGHCAQWRVKYKLVVRVTF